jgi:hypothetical protein
MADVVDHPLSDQEVSQLAERPGREGQVVILRAGQRDLLDRLSLRKREGRRPATGVLRVQRIEPVVVEVMQHRPDTVLGGEGHLGDLGHVHALRGKQHHLRPPPRHHRPRRTPHDLEEPLAFLVADLPDPDAVSHRHLLNNTALLRRFATADATPADLPAKGSRSRH